LSQVSGKSYLSQAAEIFSKSKPKTDQLTHPETFMRARALQLWVEESSDLDVAVARMLEESDGMEELDLMQQVSLSRLTKRFLAGHLRPEWFRSEPVLAHARLYFPDFTVEGAADDASLTDAFEAAPRVPLPGDVGFLRGGSGSRGSAGCRGVRAGARTRMPEPL
jgi:hypothetical protein